MTELTCHNISFKYQNSLDLILDQVNLKIFSPQSTALVGLNGSGKTTFLKLLAGILVPTEGQIYYDKKLVKNINSTKPLVTILPENAKLFLVGPTVLDEFLKIFSSEDEVFQLLKKHNLELLTYKKLYELSEGQRRLIALLSAFHQNKEIFLLDEPTIGLDSTGRELLFDLIEKIKRDNRIIIVATNDNRILPRLDRIIGLRNGKLLVDGTPADVLPSIYDTLGIIPNQVSRLIMDLKKIGIEIPNLTTVNELNAYLQSLVN